VSNIADSLPPHLNGKLDEAKRNATYSALRVLEACDRLERCLQQEGDEERADG
jgi:hypothetical protein